MLKKTEDFLKKLKEYGIKKHIPNISETKGKFLHFLVRSSGAKRILEIGCANGYSTIWLADAAADNKGKITAIDFSMPSFNAAVKNIKETDFAGNVSLIFGNALDIIPGIKQKFDFVFVDGEKRSYGKFWELIQNRLNKKAIIVFDDIYSLPEKTADFIKQIKKLKGFDTIFMPMDDKDGILLIYKY